MTVHRRGIGITPLLPMIEAASAAGSDWTLVYGGRALASMAFQDQLASYGDRVQFLPEDAFGQLPARKLLTAEPPDVEVYCCAPEGLLAAVEAAHADRDPARLHVERFAPAQRETEEVDEPFTVTLRRSGCTLTVPADGAILDILEEAGVDVNYACGEGTCGTCETVVCAGRPDHRDSVLTEAEREAGEIMMICVSRSLSGELVLDL